MTPSNSPLTIEIRIHSGSGAFNSTHGNIETAVTSALQSAGHTNLSVDIIHCYRKVDGCMVKVVVHQKNIQIGTLPVIAAGERTKAMQARIERALRKIIGDVPRVIFKRDAVPAPRQSYEQMKPLYARPNPGRNSATNGHQAVARM